MFLFKGQVHQAVRESTSLFESDRKSGSVRDIAHQEKNLVKMSSVSWINFKFYCLCFHSYKIHTTDQPQRIVELNYVIMNSFSI